MIRRFFDSDEDYKNYLIQEKLSALHLIDTQLGIKDYVGSYESVKKDLECNHNITVLDDGFIVVNK